MYPFLRMAYHIQKHRNRAPLTVGEVHVSRHICWPWDLDLWNELNNGRTLTVCDLGRIPMAYRTGLVDTLKRERWGLVVAGALVQYRKRVRGFAKIEMRSRVLSWDDKFFYIEQTMWLSDGSCASQAIFRSAVTDKNGIVAPNRAVTAMGANIGPPPLPNWIEAWSAAERLRPWPPSR